MASNPRKKRNPNRNSPQTPKYSSTSSNLYPLEPSFKLFPSSKADFVRLIGVFAVAASVAVVCKFIAASLNHPVKPFCDSNSELDDFLSECKQDPDFIDFEQDDIEYDRNVTEGIEIGLNRRKDEVHSERKGGNDIDGRI